MNEIIKELEEIIVKAEIELTFAGFLDVNTAARRYWYVKGELTRLIDKYKATEEKPVQGMPGWVWEKEVEKR